MQHRAQETQQRDTLAARLDHLFSVAHPPHRAPYTAQEVASAISATGRTVISAKYLSELRTGQRRHLPESRAAAICDFFGVPPRYLTDQDTADQTDQELALLAALRSENVRHLALRAARLPPEELADVIAGVERCLTAAGTARLDQ
jgi:transcriptional regulator with XRE-family HTH domain